MSFPKAILRVLLIAAPFALLSACASKQAYETAAPSLKLDGPRTVKAPKNVIFFIGDGMSPNHLDAANAFLGAPLTLYDFPVRLHCSTYFHGADYDSRDYWTNYGYAIDENADGEKVPDAEKNVVDSAASATAISTGFKTDNGKIGMGPEPGRARLPHLGRDARALGKAYGVVTSVPFNHATPASFIAYNESRGNYQEIGTEMINSGATVILGAGHPMFDGDGLPSGFPRYRYIKPFDYERLSEGRSRWTYIEETPQFEYLANYDNPTPKKLFGLVPVESTLQQGRTRAPREEGEVAEVYEDPLTEGLPDLATLTKAALNTLEEDPEGFFLMVEGGAIDWASHANDTPRMIEEMIDFDRAIAAALDWAENRNPGGLDDTLIVITADHDCGYPTGTGSGRRGNGPDIWYPVISQGIGKVPALQWGSTYHANSLVPFLAIGAGSEVFYDFADQYDIRQGAYLDHTDIPTAVRMMWQAKYGLEIPEPTYPVIRPAEPEDEEETPAA
ncbi:MAG: alkaline phosphatase [Sumerlaeia bacterium]